MFIRNNTNIFEIIDETEKVYRVIGASRERNNIYSLSKRATGTNTNEYAVNLCDGIFTNVDGKVEICLAVRPDIVEFLEAKGFEDIEAYGYIRVATGLKFVCKSTSDKKEWELI